MALQKPNLDKPAFQILPREAEKIKEDACPMCSKPIREEDFTDEISKKEYTLSGLCQTCQNSIFG